MNYKTFSNLQFTRLLENSSHIIQIDLRDERWKNTFRNLLVQLNFFRCLEKIPTIISNLHDVTRCLLQDK